MKRVERVYCRPQAAKDATNNKRPLRINPDLRKEIMYVK
jgi:hypothetical protein